MDTHAVSHLVPPSDSDDWVALTDTDVPVAVAYEWVQRPNCGAVVLFSGLARDHAVGRDDVDLLEYEAYESQVEPRLRALATEGRRRWPAIERVALIHRVGQLQVGDTAVVAVVSSPHRPEAFEAARFFIDALKATVPIWKRERWAGGEHWGLDAQHVVSVEELAAPIDGGPRGQ